ncbi:MAG: PilZ domain-containing protein [Sneathiella sp.]|nr:PilZ domain-containing protein [Sneathiella sp.]
MPLKGKLLFVSCIEKANVISKEEQRKYDRNTAPRVIFIIEGKTFLAENWSPDGFCIEFPDHSLSVGDTISGEIHIFEVEDTGNFTATIVRIEEKGILAAKFSELSSNSYINLCLTVSIPPENFT